ncbi:MAG: SDR family oxidoreductase [Chlorobi bacterium]|nr:SDR family oxidoreductase [Chlorobiota bacterium]
MEKIALITGAASGIGLALAGEAARDGYSLLLVDKNSAGLQQATDGIKQRYPDIRISFLAADLSRNETVGEILNKIKETGAYVSMLINCAGFGVYGNFFETVWERELEMISVHIETPTRLIKEYLPGMIKNGEGYILNVASLAGFIPGPVMAVYYATKAYLISFSRAVAAELRGTGVSIAVLCPGVTHTGFSRTVHGKTAGIAKSGSLSATAESVARYGYRSLKKGRIVVIPGLVNKILYSFQRIFPSSVVVRMVKRSQERIGRSVQRDI